MISIVPADESTRSSILNGVSIKQANCLTALNNADLLGYILYQFTKDSVELLDLKAEDKAVGDGLIRAAFHIAQGKGIDNAICKNKKLYSIYLQELVFSRTTATQGSTEYTLDIKSILQDKCQH